MSNNTPLNTSNQNRLYTGLINSFQILQFLGYFIVIISGYLRFTYNFNSFLIYVVIICIFIYMITQSLIAIIDLLSRIERNTRSE